MSAFALFPRSFRHASTSSLKSQLQPVNGRYASTRLVGFLDGPHIRRYASVRYIKFPSPNEPKEKSGWQSWSSRKKWAVGLGSLTTIYVVSNLERVPETGRWRFMNTSPSFEAQFAKTLRDELFKELEPKILPDNHPLSIHVRRVVSRILHASNLGVLHGEGHPVPSPFGVAQDAEGHSWNPDTDYGAAADPGPVYGPNKEWEVIVVNDAKMINAMATPGLIVVYTGILPVCQDEDGLAAVLGHEIGHVVARHTAERLSAETIAIAFFALLFVTGLDFGYWDVIHKYFVTLPNSRTQEHEADILGLRLMSRACYQPEACPQMFARLGQIESKMSKGALQFFQTHPSSESRVKRLEEKLPEAHYIQESNPECEHRRQFDAFRDRTHDVTFKFDRKNNAFDIL